MISEDDQIAVEIEVAVSRPTVLEHGWATNSNWEETADVRIPRSREVVYEEIRIEEGRQGDKGSQR